MAFHNRDKKDFNAGIMYIAIGGFFAGFAQKIEFLGINGYPMGTAVRMGPAYFPTILGAMLIFLGLVLVVRGLLTTGGEPPTKTHWRPLLCIIGAALLFATLIDKAGMVPAAAAMMIVGSFGGWDFRWKEQLIGMIVMPSVCVGIFYYGLGLPFRLFPWS